MMATAAENIKARQEAESLVELAGEQPQRFWEILRDLAAEKLPAVPQPADRYPALTDVQAIRFEARPMPYGKHVGESVGEVPCDYLLFLTEGDEFSQMLRRYVKSGRFQDRQ
jgi:hypothetical protein